jgi:hypothetical protein
MAATVLNGTGTVNYTNSTGGNVRVIINYFGSSNPGDYTKGFGITIAAGGSSFTAQYAAAIGKNLALNSGISGINGYGNASNMVVTDSNEAQNNALPVEFYLSSSQTFNATLSGGTAQYNIVVIPENG